MKEPLQKADPDGFDSTQQHVFDDIIVDSIRELEELWEGIQDNWRQSGVTISTKTKMPGWRWSEQCSRSPAWA
jgi:hypothetical protein